ncbi:MAG: M1 family metallopeptidase [Thermoplasmata archaeon]|nr:M1 family metallopeptidase [Thermoplasmata archaeon]
MTDPPFPSRVREYRLTLDVDFRSGAFRGSVDIDLEATGPTVALHSVDLSIGSVTWNGQPTPHTLLPALEEIHVQGTSAGAGTLHVEFAGRVAEKGLYGLYRSKFGDGSVLTTQCAATATRRVFPCVDRPDRRAVITLDLTTDPDLDVIFNTPSTHQEEAAGRRRWTFTPTPSMPTYLMYLGIGPFLREEDASGRVRLGVALPKSRAGSGRFALEATSLILPAYERYFGIPYPLPKLDLIAVPELGFGAMENWGAITFRDMRLLVDARTTTSQRDDTLTTIAHEVAHQWFGNLVTMAWWDDIWLNESFATLMEPRILSRVHPESRRFDEFVLGWTATGLFGDSLSSTHPVAAPVSDPSEIAQIFDEISYGKGSSVLRMVEGYLGEEVFRRGVQSYLEKFRYGNARGADLWNSLEQVSGLPVGRLLEAWIGRGGLPVIEVNEDARGLRLRQRPFRMDGAASAPPWPIPVFADVDGASRTFLFDTEELEVPAPEGVAYHLNRDALGFYRTLYPPAGYDRLAQRFPLLPALSRFSLLVDLYAFLLSGDVDLERYLGFVGQSARSKERLVVEEVARELVGRASPREPVGLEFVIGRNARFHEVTGEFFHEQYHRLVEHQAPGEPSTNGQLRAIVARGLVWNDLEFAREFAARFSEWDTLDPDLKGAAAIAYARCGGAREHAEIVERLRATEDEGGASLLEVALTAFPDPSLLGATLDLLRTPSVNRGHIPGLLWRCAMNPDARRVTFEWLTRNLDGISQDFPGTGYVGDILERTVPFLGLGNERSVERFVRDHAWPESDRGIAKGLAVLGVTAGLARRYP